MKRSFPILGLLALVSCRSFHDAESRGGYITYGEADFTADAADDAGRVSAAEFGVLYGDGEDGRMVGFVGDIALRGSTGSQTFDGTGAELHQLGLRTGVRYYWDTRTRAIQPYLGAGLLFQHAWDRSSTLGVKTDDSALGFVAMVGVEAMLGDALRLGLGCQLTLGIDPELDVYSFDLDSVTPLISLGYWF